MIRFTCQPPDVRANNIRQGSKILNYQYLQQFGIRVSNEMAVVKARVLPAPILHYHPSSREAAFVPKNGAWNVRDKKVAAGATLRSWACVAFGDFQPQTVQHFLRELITTCQDTGMNIPNRNPPIVN